MVESKVGVNFKNDLSPKISENIILMLTVLGLRYFGEFSLKMDYIKVPKGDKTNPKKGKEFTCGVNVGIKGPRFYWGEEFVESLTKKACNFVQLHECLHLLFDHPRRSACYNHVMANYVQDMIINQLLRDRIMRYSDNNKYMEEPKDAEGKNTCLFVPKEYTGNLFFEELYAWFQEQLKKRMKQRGMGNEEGQNGNQNQQGSCQSQSGQGGNQQGSGQGEDSEDDSNGGNEKTKDSRSYGKNGQNDAECYSLNDVLDGMIDGNQECLIGEDMMDDIPKELRDRIINDIKTNLRNRGLQTSDIEVLLNELYKSEENHLKKLKRMASQHLFKHLKYKTITRPSRKDIEGYKGFKKMSTMLNCILDTSGSMSGDFEHILSYIFHNDIHLNLIQIDTEVKDVIVIKNKKDLTKMAINGLGGTELQPGIDYIANDKKLRNFNTIILTDGYTDTLNFSNHKNNALILSCGTECSINGGHNKVKQILVPKK